MFIKRDIIKLIIPMIIQNVLSILVGTADSMMVSSAGEAAVSGVSLVGSVDSLLVLLFSSLVTGGAITVSHALGSGDRQYTRNSAKQLFYVALTISTLVCAFAVLFRVPLINTLYSSAEKTVIQNGVAYMGIVALSFPFLAISETGTALLRVMGNTTTSMYLSLLTNAINITGNAIFIYGLGMGVRGAAMATVIARASYAIIITAILHNKKRSVYYERLWQYKPDFNVVKKILRIGIPHGIESSMFQFGRLVTQVLISGMGTSVIAANSVANTLANYLYLPSNAIQNAAVTVVGRCYGAMDFKEAKKYAKMLLWWTYLCMWVVSLLLCIFVRPITSLYNLTDEGRKIAVMLTLFHALCVSTVRPLAFVLPAIFKSAGDVRLSMFVSPVSMWVVRIGSAFILSLDAVNLFGLTIRGLGLGILGVWVAMLGDWVVRAVIFTPYFAKNKWLKKKNA